MTTNLEQKRRFGLMTSEIKDLSVKAKYEYFMALFANDYEDVKVNFAVFSKNAQCLKISKQVCILDLLRYISWSGFRTSIDQILLKMRYTLESGKDQVYNLSLADDFNLNILVVAKKKNVEVVNIEQLKEVATK